MSQLQLTPATLADIEALSATQDAAFAEDVILYGRGPDGVGDPAWHATQLTEHTYLALKYAEQIIGGMLIEEQGDQQAYLHLFFIDPAYQGKGYGQQALRLLEQYFPHITRWSLHTPHRSYRNHYFYEKMGYRKIGETTIPPVPNLVQDFVLFEYERQIVC